LAESNQKTLKIGIHSFMGVGIGEKEGCAPRIFIHGTDIVDYRLN